jgi:shikimate kinase
MIRLIGPGGAGKSTTGVLLAERLAFEFIDLDRMLTARIGDISEFIDRRGYNIYARENVEAYRSLIHESIHDTVVALSSGFMTYTPGVHPEYPSIRRDIERSPDTFVLLPAMDLAACIAETVRRQAARPFGRSPAREEGVIRARFASYMAMAARKIETMRPVAAVVEEIVLIRRGSGPHRHVRGNADDDAATSGDAFIGRAP